MIMCVQKTEIENFEYIRPTDKDSHASTDSSEETISANLSVKGPVQLLLPQFEDPFSPHGFEPESLQAL